MKKKKVKTKKVEKRKDKSSLKGFKRIRKVKDEIFYSLIGYFVGVFLVNFVSRGVNPTILFNPTEAVEVIAGQISTLINIPRFVTVPIGILLTFIPMIFVYVLARDLKNRK